MFKFMLVLSTLLQMFISTSKELIGNERGNVVVDPPPATPPVVTPPAEPVVTPPTPSKNELLRELSKEHGVDLFSAEGISKFKKFQDSQKTDLEKMQSELDTYKTKETEWTSTKLEYESKIKASELGISQDKLGDALKLAGGDVEKLAEVVEKYPVFKTKKGFKIGATNPNDFQDPKGLSEQEKYMAANPRLYKK